MIDLKRRGLPNAIIAPDGGPVLLDTDFRIWINFPERIQKLREDPTLYEDLFMTEVPILTQEVADQLQDFYYRKPEVPRDTGGHEDLLDYDLDADYIYAAFMQAYKIDLVDADLHWHKFLALLTALPDTTTMSKIMGYRSYEGSSKDPGHKDYMKLKQMWSLPVKHTEEEQKMIDDFNELFG